MLTFEQAQEVVFKGITEVGGDPAATTLVGAGIKSLQFSTFANAIKVVGFEEFGHAIEVSGIFSELASAMKVRDLSIAVFKLSGGKVCERGHPLPYPFTEPCEQCERAGR
jgi:hypothetical protein